MNSIYGLNSYTNNMYKWQNGTFNFNNSSTDSQKSSSTQSILNKLMSTSSTSSMTQSISSLVDLTKYVMDEMGVADNARVTFSQLEKYRNQVEDEFNTAVHDGLAALNISSLDGLSFTLDSNGLLKAHANTPTVERLAQNWLDANPAHGLALLDTLNKADISTEKELSFSVAEDGTLTALSDLDGLQEVLDTEKESVGEPLATGLLTQQIDPDVSFTIQLNDTGDGVTINSADATATTMIQTLFDTNSDLVKAYKKIEALSGIDTARAAMQISPTEMRKRIQIESMSAWWDSSSQNTSWFGNYSNGSLSLLSRLNLNV